MARDQVRWHHGDGPDDEDPEPGAWYAEIGGLVIGSGYAEQRGRDKGRCTGRVLGIFINARTVQEFKATAERYVKEDPRRLERLRTGEWPPVLSYPE